jgi:hypothetical protein
MPKLDSLIAQSGLPRETKAILGQIRVTKVKIDKKNRCLILQVVLPQNITERETSLFCDLIL